MFSVLRLIISSRSGKDVGVIGLMAVLLESCDDSVLVVLCIEYFLDSKVFSNSLFARIRANSSWKPYNNDFSLLGPGILFSQGSLVS